MHEMRREIRACKGPILKDQRLVKRACDSTGCVGVKATHDEPEFRFCFFKQHHIKNEINITTLQKKLCFKLYWCLHIKHDNILLRLNTTKWSHTLELDMWQKH